uniref:Uncharacterized protein n=1 Tax=Tanacetum cinerariifolium TaxID=118510 RepID=A0A6L2JNX9_TANCI|nr:hypothetical protein [Tanacetum cinerariifolium]
MVHSKSISTKKQSQQVNPDDEGEYDLNIADDVTHDKHQSIAVMEKPRQKRGINKVKILPVGRNKQAFTCFYNNYLHIYSGHHVLLLICPNHERGLILDYVKVVGHLSWEFPIVNVQEDTVAIVLDTISDVLLKVNVYKRVKFDQATGWIGKDNERWRNKT